MPRLRILYDIEGWAYHRRALALQRYAPPDYEVTLAPVAAGNTDGSDPNVGEDPPDLLFCLVASHIQAVRQALSRRGWTTPLIGAWTSGWPLRIWQYYEVYDHADLTIVNNRDCWVRTGKLPGTTLVPNGVDHEVFHVRNELSGRTPKVLWTGSRFHSHVKGYDSRILPLLEALRDEGIPAESLLVDSFAPHKRSAEEMATWYNQGTVLVCASETEGTPNPCLEAAACGCTLVSTSVGNMPELIADGVNGYLVEPTVDALLEGVREAIAGYTELAANMQRDGGDGDR